MRGNDAVTKCHYKGNTDDFVIIVESEQAVKEWLADRSIPLAQVVNGFKIFVTHKHGNQGTLDTASKASLENEFSTKSEDECLKIILEKGKVEKGGESGRDGDRNSSQGGRQAH